MSLLDGHHPCLINWTNEQVNKRTSEWATQNISLSWFFLGDDNHRLFANSLEILLLFCLVFCCHSLPSSIHNCMYGLVNAIWSIVLLPRHLVPIDVLKVVVFHQSFVPGIFSEASFLPLFPSYSRLSNTQIGRGSSIFVEQMPPNIHTLCEVHDSD